MLTQLKSVEDIVNVELNDLGSSFVVVKSDQDIDEPFNKLRIAIGVKNQT